MIVIDYCISIRHLYNNHQKELHPEWSADLQCYLTNKLINFRLIWAIFNELCKVIVCLFSDISCRFCGTDAVLISLSSKNIFPFSIRRSWHSRGIACVLRWALQMAAVCGRALSYWNSTPQCAFRKVRTTGDLES